MGIIKKRKTDIGESKDIENSVAEQRSQAALLEYIIICDHPEILESEEPEALVVDEADEKSEAKAETKRRSTK